MKRAVEPCPCFHRLDFQGLTLLLRMGEFNGVPDSSCVLASFKDQTWFAVSERTLVQERYHLEGLSEADMIYIQSGHLRLSDPESSKLIEDFKARNDPAKEFAFRIPPGVEEVPVARSVFFKRQTYQKLIAGISIKLVSVDAGEEMTVDLFHSHEHHSTRKEGDYDRTVFASTRLRFVPFAF
jgi:hypothetical protein